jgi:hypothetical protein
LIADSENQANILFYIANGYPKPACYFFKTSRVSGHLKQAALRQSNSG